MFEKLPEELKQNARFCLWRYEERGNGKPTKMPYRLDGQRASSTDRAHFCSFERAVEAVADSRYSGIGLGIFDGFCAIDIDHCYKDGAFSEMAKDVILTMRSYAEISPSGEGVRIIFRARDVQYDKSRYYINNQKLGLEVYVSGATSKYVTLTGNMIGGKGVEERSAELMQVLERYMRKPLPQNGQSYTRPAPHPSVTLSDTELIQKAMRASNGSSFRFLWEGGIPSGKSHSEADGALCAMLAFWCGGDTVQMDRLFRSSGLYREKWEREDYRTSTLNNAVALTREFYKPYETASAAEDFADNSHQPRWEKPIPFEQADLPSFPVNALPKPIADYVQALSESVQTPVDMAGTAALAVLALCTQGKYRIYGKSDWSEPLNLFAVVVAEPSERKSAIISAMMKPVDLYESEYNRTHAAAFEQSRMQKNILLKKKNAIEEAVAKGKKDSTELSAISEELAQFKERRPLKLYADDVTTEKLTSLLAENGRTAVISAEGGIFDLLSGMYSKNVNIDVFLKGYSGDSIRVDRIGRNSESIHDPALTVLLAVQPSVLSGLMENRTFRGRGLTARFLYSVPRSRVGNRKYRTEPVSVEVEENYYRVIQNILSDESSDVIKLSPEADKLLEAFSDEVERGLKSDYSDIADWAGKIVGGVLRIAGILCRASVMRFEALDLSDELIVTPEIMQSAIDIGKYYISHAKSAFSLMGADALTKQSKYVLDTVIHNRMTEFSRRDIMRICRSIKTAEELQPILDHLTELGYLAPVCPQKGQPFGRPQGQKYALNPNIQMEQDFCPDLSREYGT